MLQLFIRGIKIRSDGHAMKNETFYKIYNADDIIYCDINNRRVQYKHNACYWFQQRKVLFRCTSIQSFNIVFTVASAYFGNYIMDAERKRGGNWS